VARIADAFGQQAQFCDALRAPFTAALCRAFAAGIDPNSLTGRRLACWPGEPMTDALPMRMTGALHWLVRAGRVPALAALYPPATLPDDAALAAAVAATLADPNCDAAIADFLDSAPQTNEVGRAGALLPGLLIVADETKLPLALMELGASAGLNLNMDRFCADLGGVIAGDPASTVRIAPAWKGKPPPAVALRIVSRQGVDLAPLDVASDAVAERLLAFIWPDQPERQVRTAAAIALGRRWPPILSAADAADWLEQQLVLTAGAATVVYHSIAFQYFPAAAQQRIRDHLEALGAAASPSAPLAWLRMEMDDPAQPATPAIRLRLWQGGPPQERLLGHAHPHGTFVKWNG
jgi:hypothetical protein